MLCICIGATSTLVGNSALFQSVGRALNCDWDFNGRSPPFILEHFREGSSNSLEVWRFIYGANPLTHIFISLSIKHASVILQASSNLDSNLVVEISNKSQLRNNHDDISSHTCISTIKVFISVTIFHRLEMR